MTIYDELHSDHLKLIGLIDELLDMPDRGDEDYRTNLIRDIEVEVVLHVRAEEKLLFDSMRSQKNPAYMNLLQRALKQHREVEQMLYALREKNKQDEENSSAVWRSAAEDFRDALVHHISHEELKLIPVARKAFTARENIQMGTDFLELKNEMRVQGIPMLRYA